MAEATSRLKIDIEFAKKEIQKANAKRVLIQIPEGLKDRITSMISELGVMGYPA